MTAKTGSVRTTPRTRAGDRRHRQHGRHGGGGLRRRTQRPHRPGQPAGPDRADDAVRASGRPYTIVRPGCFDHNAPDEHKPVLLQGDRRRSGGPSDGVVSRRLIAEVLVAGLASEVADRKTFELVAERGLAPDDLDPLFAALDSDEPNSLDCAHDEDNLPRPGEPARVRADLEAVLAPAQAGTDHPAGPKR